MKKLLAFAVVCTLLGLYGGLDGILRAGEESVPNKQVESINDAVQNLQRDNKRLRARLDALEDLPTVKKELKEAADAAAKKEKEDKERAGR